MSTFQDILNKPANQIEKPTPIPMGTYLFLVDGQPKFDKSPKQQTDFVEFQCRVLQPGQDVDVAAIQEFESKFGPINGRQMRLSFFDAWKLANKDGTGFLDHLGVDTTKALGEAISEAPGRQFYGTVTHKPSINQSTGEVNIYANITGTAKV
jgi:hypothetical protein